MTFDGCFHVGSAVETMVEVVKYRAARERGFKPNSSLAAMRMASGVDSSGVMCEWYAFGSKSSCGKEQRAVRRTPRNAV